MPTINRLENVWEPMRKPSPAVESVSGNFAIRPNGGGADLATFIASASVEN